MNVPNQRIVYLNGEFVPESEAKIPFRDRGVKFGDAVLIRRELLDMKSSVCVSIWSASFVHSNISALILE